MHQFVIHYELRYELRNESPTTSQPPNYFQKSSTQLKTLLNEAYENLHRHIWNNLPRLDIKRREINSVEENY
ncbi:MAG: hypothetical protein CNIPEHKO_00780 [Anaerolineales bacterium]|nr:hypothetical protein [Anaerolineales bacterium]